MTMIPVSHRQGHYDICLARGCLSMADTLLSLDRRVMILTDSGVPAQYSKTVAQCCQAPHILTIPMGEQSKSFSVLEEICRYMADHRFSRHDCIVAVGGGVVGDLGGFAGAIYMRGIDVYQIPTTVLAQVDSSVGGKTAIDLGTVKNGVGAFYPPRRVLIDTDTLATLDARQYASGLAEAVKMALTGDASLFTLFETTKRANDVIDSIIAAALNVKKSVVEQDETETGLRQILNFGHTLGHGIETAAADAGIPLAHGECVALGMLPMCAPPLRERLLSVMKRLGLPTELDAHITSDAIKAAMLHDKKYDGDHIHVTYVNAPGQYVTGIATAEELIKRLREVYQR